MKKILLAAVALACTAAFAGEGQHSGSQGTSNAQKQQQSTTSAAVAAASNQGNSQVITVAPVTTNVGSDLKDQGATAAATTADAAKAIATLNAATALEIAKLQTGAAGDRDLTIDQRAALDREAAIEIARLGQTSTVKNTPSIGLSQLTSSNDTCMGSVSVGGSGPGFSIGVGTTYTDDNCKMLKNSRELWNMGMKAASLALMCTNTANREALELTGFECPQTAKARQEAEAKAAAAKKTAELRPEITDPIVRDRMGLVALSK